MNCYQLSMGVGGGGGGLSSRAIVHLGNYPGGSYPRVVVRGSCSRG